MPSLVRTLVAVLLLLTGVGGTASAQSRPEIDIRVAPTSYPPQVAVRGVLTEKPFDELLRLLDIETLDTNLFRGQSRDDGFRQLFGGQVIAQGLVAACRTVGGDRLPQSLHAYFLRPGDASLPVIYEVERIRDGGSFTTRRVQAIQRSEPILSMMVSFHVAEDGWDHQVAMPAVPAVRPTATSGRSGTAWTLNDGSASRPASAAAGRSLFMADVLSSGWRHCEFADGANPAVARCCSTTTAPSSRNSNAMLTNCSFRVAGADK